MKRFLLFLFGSVGYMLVLAQEIKGLPVFSLDYILNVIKGRNSALKAHQSKVAYYRYTSGTFHSLSTPSIGVGSFLTPYPGQKNITPQHYGYMSLNVIQRIPIGDKVKEEKIYWKALGEVAAMGTSIEYNELRAHAKHLYVNWLYALKKVKVLRYYLLRLQIMKQTEEQNLDEHRGEYNEQSISALYKANAKIYATESEITRYETSTDAFRYQLNALMEQDINTLFTIDTSLDISISSAENFDSLNLKYYRKDIQKTDKEIDALRLKMNTLGKETIPNLHISFTQLFSLSRQIPNAFNVMLQVQLPILGKNNKHYLSQKQSIYATIKSLHLAKNQLLKTIQSRLYELETHIDMLKNRTSVLRKKVLPELEKIFHSHSLSYELSQATLDILLDDWEALKVTALNLLDEEQTLMENRIDYEKELFK